MSCFRLRSREKANRSTEAAWHSDGRVLACLSVRSGFDLVLAALQLPPGSEILVSAITIPDMVRIIVHHGLVPIPVDLDEKNAAPRFDLLENAITSATKAILVAHLYGSRIDLTPIVEFASQRGLLVLEDCAQAFDGDRYYGHEGSDVAFFSFGPIKTATALGGAVLRFQAESLRNAVRELQSQYPVQSRWRFLKRILFYCLLKWLGGPIVFGLFCRLCTRLGVDLGQLLNSSVRGFAGPHLIPALRFQPSMPLLSLMTRRITRYNPQELDDRTAKGSLLVERLSAQACVGSFAVPHSFWLFPLRVSEKSAAIAALRSAGFDASAESSLRIVEPPTTRPYLEPQAAKTMLDSTIYLPLYSAMPESEIRRMADVLLSVGPRPDLMNCTEPASV
ncbi:MAG TPA: aminotransferase class I/II-fold pyridoxal phosphate-dependent enzyme [Schlesneria sp.]